jgi:imidazolonepropionase-like amidohydrolase
MRFAGDESWAITLAMGIKFASMFGLLALAWAGAASAAPDAATLYRGLVLIDGTGAAARPGMAILTRGERIETIAPAAELPPPPGAKVVDMAGLYVTPGLINSHEHLATDPNRPWAEAMMRRDLYGGITAVRDMAGDGRQLADIARAARVGEIVGPDVYYAALMAGPAFFEDPRTQSAARGRKAGAVPWMQAIAPGADLPVAVAEAHGTGATAIKIYADLPGGEVAAITREAHRQGLLVWAHAAVFPASPKQVVEAGVDVVSHACMLGYQASDVMPRAYHRRAGVETDRFQGGINPAVEALLGEMRARRTVLDATLWVYAEMAREHSARPEGPAPYCSEPLAEALAARAYKAGVPISAGTDGFPPQPDLWPALQDELELLQDKAGMAPADVIGSATRVGALAVGRQDEMGTIAPGKLANLVFMTQDPSKDVRAFRSIVLTVKRGAPFWRKDYRPVTPQEDTGG